MPDGIRWVGLDVHARESTFAIFDQDSGEVITRRVVGRPHELLPWLGRVERPARMIYEAGPTGYGLARRALAEGIELGVCAPSRPTAAGGPDQDRQARRDPARAVLAAGELTLVTIPSVEREQLRDLVRCREDIRADLVRARHRIGNFLLRREIYCEGAGGGVDPQAPRRGSTSLQVRRPRPRRLDARRLPARARPADRPGATRIEADLAHARAHASPCDRDDRCPVAVPARDRHALGPRAVRRDRRVRALRAPRPASPPISGSCPSEHTTGRQRRRQGSITKAGSTHARRLLVEAAYHYQPSAPSIGASARAPPTRARSRRSSTSPGRAQRRLNARWRTTPATPAASPTVIVAVAIARELAHYCWEIATCPTTAPEPTPTPTTRKRLTNSR